MKNNDSVFLLWRISTWSLDSFGEKLGWTHLLLTLELRVSRTSTWWFDFENLLWRIDYSAVYEHFSKINYRIKRVHYQTKGGKTIIIKVHCQIRVWPCIVRLFFHGKKWTQNSKIRSKHFNFSLISRWQVGTVRSTQNIHCS